MTEPIVLTPLNRDVIVMRDDEGREWKLTAALRGREAVRLFHEQGLVDSALKGDDALVWLAGILSRSMRRYHPDMTPEKVLEEFEAIHIVEAVVAFLTRLGLVVSSGSQRAREAAEALTKTGTTTASESN